MAAPQWKGGKCKSVQHAKAFFRHNSTERRKETQHTNPHIDKAKTHLNFSIKGLTYEQRCAAFDARMGAVDQGRQSAGKNARTVMQSVIVYPPAGLVTDKDRLREWFIRAGQVAEQRFGDNMIDMAIDFDEVHDYLDKDGQLRTSLEHGHLWLFPEVDGKLNGKQFSRRAVINGFNRELQEMSIREFGCPMMDGSQAKGGQTVEQLKVESEAAMIIADAENEAATIRDMLSEDMERASRKVKGVERREKAIDDRVRDVTRREQAITDREEKACQAIEAAAGILDAYRAMSDERDDVLEWMKGRKVTRDGKTVFDFYQKERGKSARQVPTPEDVASRLADLRRKFGDLEQADTRRVPYTDQREF